MNEVTEKMLDYLKQIGDCAHCVDCSRKDVPRCIIIEDAIRAAIVRLGELEKAVGEWKYRTKEALDEMENQECQGLIELAEDIRDFGEDGK